jgi:hypothetical protein
MCICIGDIQLQDRLHVNVTAEEQETQERLVLMHVYRHLGSGAM